MKLIVLILSCVGTCFANAELVKMDFEVRDMQGRPIEGALVKMRMNEQPSFPYKETPIKVVSCVTDKDGMASKEFSCWEGYVTCSFSAEGYYEDEVKDVFRTSYDEDTKQIVFSENYKKVIIKLCEKINPISLFAYRPHKERWLLSRTGEVVTAGFDLEKSAWLPPYGKGETADFYLHHTTIMSNGVCVCKAELTFGEGCGAYIVKGEKDAKRPFVRKAETNAAFQVVLKSSVARSAGVEKVQSSEFLLQGLDTLVIRSRVKLNDIGQVIKANYSKIYGPLSIVDVFEIGQTCFNPTENDCNLEFDIRRNKIRRQSGVFYP